MTNDDAVGFAVTLNNQGQALVHVDPADPSGVTAPVELRQYNSRATNAFTTVVRADDSPYDSISLTTPSQNDNGQFVFLGSRTGSGDDLLVANGGGTFNDLTVPFSFGNPVLANDGRVLYLEPAANPLTDPGKLKLLRTNLSTEETIADGTAANGAFTRIGSQPGISDDGQIVAFYGERSDGKGIFANVKTTSGRKLVRIAGPADGFSDFPTSGRVALNSTHRAEGATDSNRNGMQDLEQRAVTIAFVGTKGGKQGIYSVRLNFFGSLTGGSFNVDNPSQLIVSRPTVVLEEGETVMAEQGGTMFNLGPATSFELYDSVNNRDRGDVAFRVSTGLVGPAGNQYREQAVIRARPQEVIYVDFDPVANFSADPGFGLDIMITDLGVNAAAPWSGDLSDVLSAVAPNRTDLQGAANVTAIQNAIVNQIQVTYDAVGANVKVLDSMNDAAPQNGRFTRVFVGDGPFSGTNPDTTYGIASAVDVFNQDIFQSGMSVKFQEQDTVLVFADNIFRPSTGAFTNTGNGLGANITLDVRAAGRSDCPAASAPACVTVQNVINAVANTTVHELGHAFGLAHLADAIPPLLDTLVMNATPAADEDRSALVLGTTANPLAGLGTQNDQRRLALTLGSDDALVREPPDPNVLAANVRNSLRIRTQIPLGTQVAAAVLGIVRGGESDVLPQLRQLGSGDLATLLDTEVEVGPEDTIVLLASTDGNGVDVFSLDGRQPLSGMSLDNPLGLLADARLRGELFNESGQPRSGVLKVFLDGPSGPEEIGDIDAVAPQGSFDFGDAPESYQTTLPGGPSHALTSGVFLGTAVDAEAEGQPDAAANGDDLDGTDDDDGVAVIATPVSTAASATTSSILVTASTTAKLDAWIDFNGNGQFDHPSEHLRSGTSIDVGAGVNVVSYTIPAGAATGDTFARFRISTVGGLPPDGLADDGEVEDYQLYIGDGDIGEVIIVELLAGDVEIAADGSEVTVRNADAAELSSAPGDAPLGWEFLGTSDDNVVSVAGLGILEPSTSITVPFSFYGDSGNDRLRLTGGGQMLDLTSADTAIAVVEEIDISDGSRNQLILDNKSVIDSTEDSDTLVIRHDADDTVTYSGPGWDVLDPVLVDGQQRHVLTNGDARVETINTLPWQNPRAATDVNFNEESTSLDALLIINFIGRAGMANVPLADPTSAAELPQQYVDVNGSGTATALDALLVINFLGQENNESEGELVGLPLVVPPSRRDESARESDWLESPAPLVDLAIKDLSGEPTASGQRLRIDPLVWIDADGVPDTVGTTVNNALESEVQMLCLN